MNAWWWADLNATRRRVEVERWICIKTGRDVLPQHLSLLIVLNTNYDYSVS